MKEHAKVVDHTRRNIVYDKYDVVLLSILDKETLIVQLFSVYVIDLYRNIYTLRNIENS